jgi:hypothetical protein
MSPSRRHPLPIASPLQAGPARATGGLVVLALALPFVAPGVVWAGPTAELTLTASSPTRFVGQLVVTADPGTSVDLQVPFPVRLTEQPQGFSRTFGGAGHAARLLADGRWIAQAAYRTRARSNAKPARPYIVRLMTFSRLTWPSTGPLLHAWLRPA